MRDGDAAQREALAAAAVFVLTAVAATVAWQWSGRAVTDIALYRTYGERIADGLVPYRDFPFEYPPGALPALVLPALVTDSLGAYRVVFAAEMAVAGAIGVLLLAAGLGRLRTSEADRRFALLVVALVPLLLGGVILTRFDLVPAALVAGAMLLLVTGRLRAGALIVGIGIAVKLYPAVLVPLVGIAGWRRCAAGQRELATVLALVAAPVAVAYVPFLLIAPDGVLDSLGRQLGRPLQIESLGAGAPARAPPRRRDVARVGVGQRLAEPHRRRRGHAGRAPGNRAGRRGRARLGLLRARPCEPGAARQARGGERWSPSSR